MNNQIKDQEQDRAQGSKQSQSQKQKPQIVSFIARPKNTETPEFKNIKDDYLKWLTRQLEAEVALGVSGTKKPDVKKEVSFLLRLDRPEIRRTVVTTESGILDINQSSQAEVDKSEEPGDLEQINKMVRKWAIQSLQRLVSEKASSIEFILIFKGQKLAGRRETLNAQSPIQFIHGVIMSRDPKKESLGEDDLPICAIRLTAKERRFCEEYLIDLNGGASVDRAGYTPRTAASASTMACKILSKRDVQDYISHLKRERGKRTRVTQDRVLQHLAEIGFSDMKEFASWDDDGTKYRSSDELPEGASFCISEFTETLSPRGDRTRGIKLHSKMAALNMLAKHTGVLNTDLNTALETVRKYGYELVDTYAVKLDTDEDEDEEGNENEDDGDEE